MMDVSLFQGPGRFGRSYERMYKQDVHAPGSIDRVVLGRMVQLCRETVGYLYGFPPG